MPTLCGDFTETVTDVNTALNIQMPQSATPARSEMMKEIRESQHWQRGPVPLLYAKIYATPYPLLPFKNLPAVKMCRPSS